MLITTSLSSAFVTLVVTFLVAVICYFKWSFQYWKTRNTPYLEPAIPFGNLTNALRSKEHAGVTFKKIYNEMKSKGWKHGGVYIFTKPNYFPTDLDLIRNIVTKDFQYFADRNIFVNEKQPLQAHLLSLKGERWRNLRTKLSPTFTSGKMKMMFSIMAECQNDLQQRLDKECLRNEPIDIKEILACFTTNIIGSCAFGLDFKALEDENSSFRDFGRRMFTSTRWHTFKRTFATTFPTISKFFNVSTTRKDISDFVINLVEDTVNYREKNNYTRNDFMQLLINLKNNASSNPGDHDGKPLTMDEVASQALVFFAAGFETSSTLMTFALYELSKNQQIQDRLRNEIRQVLAKHDNVITYDSIQDMKYLSQVLDESLRMHPPAPVVNRKCVKDYKIPNENVIIEKGTSVLISILGIHHDKDIYPDPEKFDPDRFSDDNRKLRHNYAHIPFGEGPRNCIGMRFGLLQAKVGLVSLIKDYKFTINKKTKEPIVYRPSSTVLAVDGEVWLNAEKVSNN